MNTPFFFKSTSTLSKQKPLSRTNTLPPPQTGCVSHSRTPTVFPFLSHSLLPSSSGWSLPSLKSTAQIMSLLQQPVTWYSFLKGQGFLGTNMNPGHVYLFTHFDMLSLMQLIQLGMKLFAMLAFTSPKLPKIDNKCWGTC